MKCCKKAIKKLSVKAKILIWLAAFSLPVFKANAQQKEWKNLLALLQKEAAWFQGKDGFIQLGKSEYNTFSIKEISVNDTLISSNMWLRDRFGNERSEQFVQETIVLLQQEPVIISAEIFYDYSFYFKDFPDAQFLQLELDEDVHLIHHVVNIYKDLETGEEDRGETEDQTNRILLPIRAKNRAEIFDAIDAYQRISLKLQLDEDRAH
jgi:hypothetical protein